MADSIKDLKSKTVVLNTGSVEYNLEEAVCEIDELISLLEQVKEEGAEYVTIASGNHRGPKFMRLRAESDWAEDV